MAIAHLIEALLELECGVGAAELHRRLVTDVETAVGIARVVIGEGDRAHGVSHAVQCSSEAYEPVVAVHRLSLRGRSVSRVAYGR